MVCSLKMNEDIGWCAGFFDGEGCIVVGTNGSLQVRVVNTSLKSLQKLQETLGYGTILPRKQVVNKPQYYWSCYGMDAYKVLKLLLPHVVDKQAQSITAMSFYSELKRVEGRSPDEVTKRRELTKTVRETLTQEKLNG